MNSAQLMKHRQHIEIVPAFNYFPVFDTNDCHSGEIDRLFCCRQTKTIACVSSSNETPCRYQIAFGNGLFYNYIYVWKGRTKSLKKRLESFRSFKVLVGMISESVRQTFRVKHLIDSFGATFIPYLLKPSMDQRSILL